MILEGMEIERLTALRHDACWKNVYFSQRQI